MLVPLSVVLGFTVATARAAAVAPKNVITILIDDLGSYDTAGTYDTRTFTAADVQRRTTSCKVVANSC